MERELFEDRFRVEAVDPNNKTPFRNVSRVHLTSYSDKQNRRSIELDINVQIYPVSINDSFLVKVSNCDHVKNVYSHEDLSRPSEKDSYDYVMYGVVFELEEKAPEMVAYASFGGLLMRVAGGLEAMSGFRRDGKEARIYLMMKRA